MTLLDRLSGEQRCLFGSAEFYCGRPATVHVLVGDAVPTLSCDAHVVWWLDHEHEDTHPVMSLCGMPGTTWMYGDPGHCAVEGLTLQAEQVATATA